ncbi:hypothetical protein [Chelativorans sp. M5D2P16]|uniref:hypothetical protein n=1 Tax=Chelativorans sp. M5D2P16 TaxID=3095678 RepID=UPI002ACAEBAC|nr:hypothetical protein [Chelativorans sp. M5D2P16]MDZ5697833.1 hypothetical protein [Chelativorans sp. M5D2P16]
MRILALSLTAFILSLSSAAMAEQSVGKVARFESNPKALVIVTGESFRIPDGLANTKVAAGDIVSVTWASDGTERVATKIMKRSLAHED